MFRLKKRLIKIMAHHTGKSEDRIKEDSDRDYWINAEEAKDYGLVDEVVKSRKDIPAEALTRNSEKVLPVEEGVPART
jgi:ATP-dependent Clp protease, protease subunit